MKLIVFFQLFFCYSFAEFLKMKTPYSPTNEFNFIVKMLPVNARNVEIDNRILLEYIQKYFPKQTAKIRFHQIDDPVIQQHKFISATSSTIHKGGLHFPNSASESNIISINGITIVPERPLPTFRPASKINSSSVPPSGCSGEQQNGTWSEWAISEACTSDCGSCGRLTRIRKCTSFNGRTGEGCPCRGEYKQFEVCNIGICQYPKLSCCPPYSLVYLDGHFACGPHNETIIQKFMQKQLSKTG